MDEWFRWGARDEERRHQEARRRELLVLIHHHLQEEGLKDTANVLGRYKVSHRIQLG